MGSAKKLAGRPLFPRSTHCLAKRPTYKFAAESDVSPQDSGFLLLVLARHRQILFFGEEREQRFVEPVGWGWFREDDVDTFWQFAVG